MTVASLEPENDQRAVDVKVAGPGALLCAKLFKLSERRGSARTNDKDALDVLRLLQAVETHVVALGIHRMTEDDRSRQSAGRAIDLLEELFGSRGAEGAIMAARAVQPLMDEIEVRLSCEVLARGLLVALRG